MSSRSRRSPRANIKPASVFNTKPEEAREPLFEFDEYHDPATVICETLTENVIQEPALNMAALTTHIKSADDDLNKSDVVVIVSAALLGRLGLTQSANRLLAISDTTRALYESLNLGTEATLKSFCTMISILNPEFVKSVENGIMASLRGISRKTTAVHSQSRLGVATKGLLSNEDINSDDLKFGAVASNVPMDETDLVDALQNVSLIAPRLSRPTYTIEPADSASVVAANSKSSLSSRDLLALAKATRASSPAGRANTLYAFDPAAKRPLIAKRRESSGGIGFAEILEEVPVEKARKKAESLNDIVAGKKRSLMEQHSAGYQAQVEEAQDDFDEEDDITI
jgi:hypothetical protein